jgi:hypothetical protein
MQFEMIMIVLTSLEPLIDDLQIETSSSSRPRIESKLGMEDEGEGSDDSKDEDTAMDNTLVSPATTHRRAHALAARNVADTLNSLTQEVG